MEYESMISRILEADRAARDVTRQARERQERLDADLEREAAAERKKCFDWAEERLAALRQETEANKADSLREQDAMAAEALSRMEQAYKLYGDNWVETLFRQTVDQTP